MGRTRTADLRGLLLDVELQDSYTDPGVLLQDGHVIAGFGAAFACSDEAAGYY
jgi:hypothetical protein